MKFLGKKFKKMRIEAGFKTVNDLFQAILNYGLETTWQTVKQWEKGVTPRGDFLVALSDLLRIHPRELFQKEREKNHVTRKITAPD